MNDSSVYYSSDLYFRQLPSGKLKYVKGPYGERFGRLLILHFDHVEFSNTGKSRCYFDMCQCDCGVVKVVRRLDYTSGAVQSCGCLRKELSSARSIKHGLSAHPLYQVWQMMIQRCYNENTKQYRWYGDVGVTVCDRWRYSFENFLADMGERPVGESLDRIDVYGNYEPGNVRWATREVQLANKRELKRINKEIEFVNGDDGAVHRITTVNYADGRKRVFDTIVHELPKPRAESCEQCGEPINPARSTMRFCSTKCRMRAHRVK